MNKKLNTGWKHWDIHLAKFVGKKINCLDIGSYKGASTCWMLNNICQNPYSRVYSVDTWEGSPEYDDDVDFKEIEKSFDIVVEATGKQNQNVKMKMTSTKALLKLREYDLIIFDFVFIDASHEAKDVISDAILSWDILNEEGILIFDDYEWKLLNEEYFKPKLAIDSFVSIYKPQLKNLYIGYQYIIEKIRMENLQKPELDDYYKLINEINYYKFNSDEIVFQDEINDEIKFKLEVKNDNKFINEIKNIDDLRISVVDKDILGINDYLNKKIGKNKETKINYPITPLHI